MLWRIKKSELLRQIEAMEETEAMNRYLKNNYHYGIPGFLGGNVSRAEFRDPFHVYPEVQPSVVRTRDRPLHGICTMSKKRNFEAKQARYLDYIKDATEEDRRIARNRCEIIKGVWRDSMKELYGARVDEILREVKTSSSSEQSE